MAETLVLTDPVVTPETAVTTYRVLSLLLALEAEASPGVVGLVAIDLRDNLDQRFSHSYTGDAAISMIKTLNTANLSVKSLHKRVLEKLSADGVLPGTVTGTPDAP